MHFVHKSIHEIHVTAKCSIVCKYILENSRSDENTVLPKTTTIYAQKNTVLPKTTKLYADENTVLPKDIKLNAHENK